MKKLVKGKIYKFDWNDTYSENGWLEEREIDEKTLPMLHQSVGYLVKENKTWYIVAQNKNSTQGFRPWALISWIPKGSVVKITSL